VDLYLYKTASNVYFVDKITNISIFN